jgi:signal transduction histidine kinase
MSDQGFESEPHGFCIGHCATGFLRVAKRDLINVERFLHTSKITISIQRHQPYPIRLVLLASGEAAQDPGALREPSDQKS